MKLRAWVFAVCMMLALPLYAGPQSYYCPQRGGYINVGMSAEQVIAACGEPLSRQDYNNPIYVRVNIKQLIYNNQGTDVPYAWRLASWGFSTLKSGSGGVQLEINVGMDDLVKLVRVNSSNTNSTSVCNGINIKVGDPMARVYSACGNPSVVNNTFVNQMTTPTTKPQLWVYQSTEYQSPFTLIIVDGKLFAINIQREFNA